MKTSFFLRGSGGQGVQVVGMMLLHAINEQDGYASFFPEYGSNKRGGFSQCAVMTSGEPIYSFAAATYDAEVLLNQDSYDKFGDSVKKGGILILNSSLISHPKEHPDITVLSVPFDELARQVGDRKVMNTLVFGFLTCCMDVATEEEAGKIVEKMMAEKPAYLKWNLTALKAGFAEAKKRGYGERGKEN
ncbi:2-oxoacid:acceptor oxidoreductase family protein [Cuneatibacter sp. NSJ-177]|uniref:2-oxoacid:acceptor oxidoreductase family protein n=1 Tax=Cuneatibacter sp. NSJ-177 TaxID=2931401 RepID=UPI001FD1E79F|nr:2-oxoacid:acceptor oxidoreductase family protein [Cuneatibacter sp. NSJ-177]MCJ7837513.1 2-oxoacid:acceptor oxidoreductase family protein [Cuneatibacter sp. NSJ-177]